MPGKQKTLVATGVDANGQGFTFANPVWQITGGGTLTNHANTWTFTADAPGKWELTCTDPQVPGITGKATVLVAGVVLDGNGTLQIIGTAGNDTIRVSQVRKNTLRVEAGFLSGANRTRQFSLDQVNLIEIYGGAGRDALKATGVSTPLWIDGGQGDDLIWGGAGADILLGRDGNDTLRGQGGRDLLLGGDGRDQLYGDGPDDILIGGRTVFSDPLPGAEVNRFALQAILNEWNSTRSNSVRRANLGDGSGSTERLNDNYFLQLGSTVLEDGWRDSHFGSLSNHWRVPS